MYARHAKLRAFPRLMCKRTPDCIQDISLQTSPWGDRSSAPHRGAGNPPRTFEAQTQSLCPESPFDPRRRTSPLYWNGHYLRGILPLESDTVKYSHKMAVCAFSTYLIWFWFIWFLLSLNSSLPNRAFLPGVKTEQGLLELYPAFLAPVGIGFPSLVSCWTCLCIFQCHSLKKDRSLNAKRAYLQVDALFNDLFLLLEDLKLLWVVSAWHLGAVATDARRRRGVQWVNAPIAVDGFWSLGVRVLLFWWFLLAWRGWTYIK